MNTRLAIFASHPIQYQVPLWRGLAAHPGLDVEVFYFSDHSVRGGVDPDFGVPTAWDVPLLDGYKHCFLSRAADLSRPHSIRVTKPMRRLRDGGFHWILVQGYTFGFDSQMVRVAKRLGIKVLMRGEFADHGVRRGWLKRIVRDRYLRWLYAQVDAFGVIGVEARRHLLRLGVSKERLFFSPYSVDTALFETQRRSCDRTITRGRLGLTDRHFVFLFSGKLIPRKAPLLLLAALERLSERDRLALIVLGDGPLRETVVAGGNALLGERFIFPGFVNQSRMAEYFMAADAFVLPANYDAWGLVVNEAMQFGLPVITTDRVMCHEDLIVEGQTGYVVPADEVETLAGAMQHLLDDRRGAAAMGDEAQRRVQLYSTEASVQGLLQAIGV